MRKIQLMVVLVVLQLSSMLIAQESKVRVIVERANIYAEASTESYRIERIRKGMILTLFGKGQTSEKWLYVHYQSTRWNSQVTGFILADKVEAYSPDQKPEGEAKQALEQKPETEARVISEEIAEKKKTKDPEKKPEKTIEIKPVDIPTETKKKSEVKKELRQDEKPVKKSEAKGEGLKALNEEVEKAELRPSPTKPKEMEEPIREEEVLGYTSVPSGNTFSLSLPSSISLIPRIYEIVEPPEPEISVTEELETAPLPKEKNPELKPTEKIDTEVWEKKVVIPDTTVIPEKERDIEKQDIPEKKDPPKEEEPQIIEQKQPGTIKSRLPRGKSLFTFSLGYGPSLGGLGGFIQLNASRDLSVHWGVGYYPTSMFYPDFNWVQGRAMVSVGLKYYLPWRTEQVHPYIDLQYGGISVEAIRVVTGIWYYTYVYENIQKTLWGPSLLAGVELRLGSFGLNGAVGASYVLTKWEHWDQPLFISADIGFLVYF
jgi:hypothetical protein